MIGIVCFWDRYATPYLKKYEDILDSMGVDYEVIFWNRNPNDDADIISQVENVVNINIDCIGKKLQKIQAFYRWKKIARRIIKEKKYDHLIVLSTVPAVLLCGILMRKYRNNYLFDIRDYTLEKNKLFKYIVMQLIKGSVLTAISSKGFMRWLNPSPKIMINHNITVNHEKTSTCPRLKEKETINFAFVGNVRLDAQTQALLLALKEENRIEQHYYGRILPSCNIGEIATANNVQNLFLHGSFDVLDKPQIFENVDLINCVYANAEKEEDIALEDSTPLPNRLYDSIIFYRPMVASKGTYLSELVQQYHLGCSVNGFSKNACDDILKYVDEFDEALFTKGCDELRAIVTKEELEFLQAVKNVLEKW